MIGIRIAAASSMLSQILSSDKNSLNLIRLMAALAVLISHAHAIHVGPGHAEPLSMATPFTLGQHAVNAFFFISGLTLSYSLARNPSIAHFAVARCLRLIPGLFCFGVVFAFGAGPILTSWKIGDYITDAHTYLYPFAVLVEFARAIPPHGIFSNAPYFEVANDPLWTIKYEIAAYVALAFLQIFGLLRFATVLFVTLAIACAMFIFTMPALETGASWLHHLARYGICFLLGAIAFRFRDSIPVSPWPLLATTALVIFTARTGISAIAYMLVVAHFVVVLAARSYGPLTSWTRTTDLSYGTYIYGWPVQQTIAVFAPGLAVLPTTFWSLLTVLPFAYLSWILIERPALNLKSLALGGQGARSPPIRRVNPNPTSAQ